MKKQNYNEMEYLPVVGDGGFDFKRESIIGGILLAVLCLVLGVLFSLI